MNSLLLSLTPKWVPLPGPQTEAYYCEADELLYGGAAGGGKTDLAIGLALTRHYKSIIFRREGTQHKGNIERLAEIIGNRKGFNSQSNMWRLADGIVELGSVKEPDDVEKYQGRPNDLHVFDEICHFLKIQYLFLKGWNRTTRPGQRCRVVCTGNPPTSSEGKWVIEHWAPWLDPKHPRPALAGELRWYAQLDGKDTEVDSGTPFMYKGELITPKSRTFIPSRVQDNPFLMASGYMSTLQALPEPLRSQMLRGDYLAGIEEDPWQVIPTAWVDAAMARWKEDGAVGPMSAVGLDVARGGKDNTIGTPRYGNWYGNQECHPGSTTPDGKAAAGVAIGMVKDGAVVNVDVIGVGSSPVDFLLDMGVAVNPINGAAKSLDTDRSGHMKFANKRSALYWLFREKLDPENGDEIALPPCPKIKADLCAPKWKVTLRGIQVESKDDIMSRLKRSPDYGDSVVYASDEFNGMFKRVWLKFMEVRPGTVNIYIIVSRATSRSRDLDNTGIAVIAVDSARNKLLIDGYSHTMDLRERWMLVKGLRRRWMQQPGVQGVFVGFDEKTHQSDIAFCKEQMVLDQDAFELLELCWPNENSKAEQDRIQRLAPEFSKGMFYLVAHTADDTSTQKRFRDSGQAYRILKPLRRKTAAGEIYDVSKKFMVSYCLYPQSIEADLLDACSRIYDMDYQPPVIVEQGSCEPEVE